MFRVLLSTTTTTCFPLMFLPPLSLYITTSFPFSLLPSLPLSVSRFFIAPLALISTMATEHKGKPLPKFGEWDVNNPASAEGFTVIFSKASDEKKTKKASGAAPNSLVSPHRNQNSDQNNHHHSQNPKAKNKWLCFR